MPVAASPAPRNRNVCSDELAAGDAQRREQPGERDRRGALDVVVEGRNLLAVFVQQAERLVIGEILELDQHAGESGARGVTNSSTNSS